MVKKPREWNRLDNAAKIFPPTTSKRDTKVFRFVCELTQDIEPIYLQAALEETLVLFPLYKSILKKGFFWYYIEQSSIKPVIVKETNPPCSPIYRTDRPNLLFQVSYFNARINLEVFHALADGTGAMYFLQNLVCAYLRLKYPDALGQVYLTGTGESAEERRADAFERYYDKSKNKLLKNNGRPYRIKGRLLPDYRLGVIESILSAEAVLSAAHQYNASLSEFLTALLILSIYDSMPVRERSKPIVVTVPVDLRRFFPAQTARNFFATINVSCRISEENYGIETVLECCKDAFQKQLTRESMLGAMNRYAALENNPFIKVVPLMLKIPCLKLAGWQADKGDTAALSNVGKVRMPEEMVGYIKLFDVFVSTKRPQICLCSYGDILAVSFSSPMASMAIQRNFFRKLVAMGIAVDITSNLGVSNEEGSACAVNNAV